jgi:hypothetical protein
MRGVSIGEKRTRLVKGNITRNLNAMSNRILTTISLTLRVVTKKKHIEPTVPIALPAHGAKVGQRQHSQKNKGGYTVVANQRNAQAK